MIWLVLVLGLILRLISLNQSFWLDEATTANVVKNFGFAEIVTQFSVADFHPPLYYFLAKAWSILFGVSEISLRALSVLFGLGTILVVYRLGSLLGKKTLGNVAAFLLATAPLHVYYSQEARMYSLETFLASLLIYFFVSESWALFAIVLALIGATDYLPLLIIPVFWVWGWILKRNLHWFTRLTFTHLPLFVFYAWWSPYLFGQLKGGLTVSARWADVLGRGNLKNLALIPVKFMIGRVGFENNVIYTLVILILGSLFGYLILKGRIWIKKNLPVTLWLLVPLVLAVFLSFRLSILSYFRLIFILPAFYLLIAVGLDKAKESAFPLLFSVLILVNLTFSCIYLLNPKFQREDWRGLVAFVQAESRDKKYAVVFPSNSQQEAFRYYSGSRPLVLGELDRSYDTIWLMRYVLDIVDPDDRARSEVEKWGYRKESEYAFNGLNIWRYLR